MSLTDRLLLGEIGIEGEFEIGITNPLTGRLYHHVKSKNVITDGMYEYLRMVQFDLLRTMLEVTNYLQPRCRSGIPMDSGMSSSYPKAAVASVYLTDGVLPENKTRRLIDGNTIAYGTTNATVSTDNKLGVLTPGECYALHDKVVRRWDFPSDKGNGTFSKISLGNTLKSCYYEVIGVGGEIGRLMKERYGLVSQPYVYYFPSASTSIEKHFITEGQNTKNTLVANLKRPDSYSRDHYKIDGNTDRGVQFYDYEVYLVDFTTGEKIKGGYYNVWKNDAGKTISSEIFREVDYGINFYYNERFYLYCRRPGYEGFYMVDFDSMVVSKIVDGIIDDFTADTYFETVVQSDSIYAGGYTTSTVYKIDGNSLKNGSFSYEIVVPYAVMYGVSGILYGVDDGRYIKFFHGDDGGYSINNITYMPSSSGISRVPIVDNAGAGPNASQLELMAEKLLPEPITKDNMPMYVSYTLKLV